MNLFIDLEIYIVFDFFKQVRILPNYVIRISSANLNSKFVIRLSMKFFPVYAGGSAPGPPLGATPPDPLNIHLPCDHIPHGTCGTKNFEKNNFLKNAVFDLIHRYFDDRHHFWKKIFSDPWGGVQGKKSVTHTDWQTRKNVWPITWQIKTQNSLLRNSFFI